jgi:hypothetical protein
MAYKLLDNQITGREFADGAIFETKEEIVDQLSDFHDIDFCGCDDKDNELSIEDYFKFWKIETTQDKLDFLLDHGDWTLEEMEDSDTRVFFIIYGEETNRELFETLEKAEEFYNSIKDKEKAIMIGMVRNAYKEVDGSWNYDDLCDTFDLENEVNISKAVEIVKQIK